MVRVGSDVGEKMDGRMVTVHFPVSEVAITPVPDTYSLHMLYNVRCASVVE